MTSRERIKRIIGGEKADRFGNPHEDTWLIIHNYFGTKTDEELRQKT